MKKPILKYVLLFSILSAAISFSYQNCSSKDVSGNAALNENSTQSPSCSMSASPSQGAGDTEYSLSIDIQNSTAATLTCGSTSKSVAVPSTDFNIILKRHFQIAPGLSTCTLTVTNTALQSANCNVSTTTVYTVEQINIDANSNLGPMKLKPGFLLGFNDNVPQRAIDLLSLLKPKFWRIGSGHTNMYEAAKQLGVTITTELPGSDDVTVQPWTNWSGYESMAKNFVQNFSTADSSGPASVYWTVRNEPDSDGFWSGTQEQLFELHKRTYDAIRSIEPAAKLIGMNYSEFIEKDYEAFLQYLYDNNLQYKAIAWHELDSYPEAVLEHVKAFRTMNDKVFASKPQLKINEIHINEYAGADTHLIPGWAVGWFYYLTEANVDWISRACWDIEKNNGNHWKDCWEGIDGLLTKDNQNPQGIYWVHKAFGAMEGQRLQSTSNNPSNTRSVALATRNDSTKEIRILAGRFFGKNRGDLSSDGSTYATLVDSPIQRAPPAPKDSRLTISNYPYGTANVTVRIFLIPNDPVVGAMLETDLKSTTLTLSVSSGTITLPFEGLQDGEALVAVITPTTP